MSEEIIGEIRRSAERCIEGMLELYSLATKLHVNSIRIKSDNSGDRYGYTVALKDGLEPRSPK